MKNMTKADRRHRGHHRGVAVLIAESGVRIDWGQPEESVTLEAP